MSQVHSPRETAVDRSSWQDSLKQAFRSPIELAAYLELDEPEDRLPNCDVGFPFLVTREFASRIKKRDWNDPLLLQVWPQREETSIDPLDVLDPCGDLKSRVAPGLIHKYQGRVLLIATGACAIHCRYCFRRDYPYGDDPKSIAQWELAIDAIERDTSISEVILSGGDPLTLPDAKLAQLIERLEAIDHLERIRIHTRLPIVLPSRINQAICMLLSQSRLTAWVVVHCNHENEIDGEVEQAIGRLRRSNATVLNQSVFLRGVNDSVEAVVNLSLALTRIAVMPYYLHLLDPVRGAGHFRMEDSIAIQIVDAAARRLPGYAIPRLVREKIGEPYKTIVR